MSEYVHTFAAAGPEFQFYAVQRAVFTNLKAVGPVLQLNTLRGRAQLILISLQLYRFLDVVERTMHTVAPVNKLLEATVNGITRTM